MAFHSYFFHHYYINPPLFHSKAHKTPIFSPLLSSSEVEQSCHILVFLRLKVLSETHSSSPNSSFPPPIKPLLRVSFSTVWMLHETIPIRYDFSKLALQAVIAVTEKPNLACSLLPPIFPFNAPDFPQD